MFPTNRGICFSLKANSNLLKTMHSCTVPAQSGVPTETAEVNPSLRQKCASHFKFSPLDLGQARPYVPKNMMISASEADAFPANSPEAGLNTWLSVLQFLDCP